MNNAMPIQRMKAGAMVIAASAMLSVAGACDGDRITNLPDSTVAGPFVVSNPILAANGAAGVAGSPGLLAGNGDMTRQAGQAPTWK